jgi:hypothetical protein
VDYQKGTVGETLKLCEALAFRLPVAMVRALDSMAEISALEMQLWWRAMSLPAGALTSVMWPQRATGADFESIGIEVEQIRAELRSDTAKRLESDAAAAARFEHLQDQLASLRKEASTLREEFKTALAKKSGEAEIDLLRTEVNVLRQQVSDAINEKEMAPAALADLQTELRALRDRMEPQPSEPEPEGKGGRHSGGEARKRPRR